MPRRLLPALRVAALVLVASVVVLSAAPTSALAAKSTGFAATLGDDADIDCRWTRGALRCLDYSRAGQGAACKSGTRVPGKEIANRKRPKSVSVCVGSAARPVLVLQPGKAWKRESVKCRLSKDATTLSCRNTTGPFVMFEAADGPVVATPSACADVPLSPGSATKISAAGVDCTAAGTLIAAVAAAHDAVNGPRTFTSGDWACAVVTDSTPPVGHYNCARGDAIVTWDRTS